MAGGIFKTQNKIRPGAYVNFKSVRKQTGLVEDRGIVTLPLSLSWGPGSIIEINNSDLIDGTLLNKVGFYGYEEEIQLIRESLKNSYKLLAYRLNSSGATAAKENEGLNISAKYPGVVGNDIKIAIKEINSEFEVIVYLRNSEVEKFKVASIDQLKLCESNFVVFEGTGELNAVGSIALEGGTDGAISENAYEEYFKTIIKKKWDTMGLPYVETTELKNKALMFAKKCREEKGKKVQIVLKDFSIADYEGIISVNQGYKTNTETVNVDGFISFIAGLTAGARANQSNTYFEIPGAVEIINEVDDGLIEDELLKGNFLLSYNQDEKVIIEKDINTFISVSDDKDISFSKNRTIRTLDTIHNIARNKFEKSYIGKVDNNEQGRNIFKSDICGDMLNLEKQGAIENFKAEDVVIGIGEDKESIIMNFNVQTVDSIEKLYMTVSLS